MDGHISQNYYGYLVSVGVGLGRICVLFSIFTMSAELATVLRITGGAMQASRYSSLATVGSVIVVMD